MTDNVKRMLEILQFAHRLQWEGAYPGSPTFYVTTIVPSEDLAISTSIYSAHQYEPMPIQKLLEEAAVIGFNYGCQPAGVELGNWLVDRKFADPATIADYTNDEYDIDPVPLNFYWTIFSAAFKHKSSPNYVAVIGFDDEAHVVWLKEFNSIANTEDYMQEQFIMNDIELDSSENKNWVKLNNKVTKYVEKRDSRKTT